MPKVVRPNRRGTISSFRDHAETSLASHCMSPSIAMMDAPRKISFEEGHQSRGSLSCLQDSGLLLNSPKCSLSPSKTVQERGGPVSPTNGACDDDDDESSRRKSQDSDESPPRSLLRRPRPSTCLVGLASSCKQEEEEEAKTTLPLPNNHHNCVSPTPSSSTQTLDHQFSSSPWGHFVDILIPPDHEQAAGEASAAALHRGLESSRPESTGLTLNSYPLKQIYPRSRRPLYPEAAPYPTVWNRPRWGKKSGFLPGFILEVPQKKHTSIENQQKTEDGEVVQALTRLRV